MSRVNRAELSWRGYMETDKMIIGGKATERNESEGRDCREFLQREYGKGESEKEKRKKETLGKQEAGCRKFLCHPPDPLCLSKNWNMTVHVLFLFSLTPFSFSPAVSVWACCAATTRFQVICHLLSALASCYRQLCDSETCSYLMSSSRSHSVWCLKCSLVICSVWVFFSSCVTLTWMKQKDMLLNVLFIHPSAPQACYWSLWSPTFNKSSVLTYQYIKTVTTY